MVWYLCPLLPFLNSLSFWRGWWPWKGQKDPSSLIDWWHARQALPRLGLKNCLDLWGTSVNNAVLSVGARRLGQGKCDRWLHPEISWFSFFALWVVWIGSISLVEENVADKSVIGLSRASRLWFSFHSAFSTFGLHRTLCAQWLESPRSLGKACWVHLVQWDDWTQMAFGYRLLCMHFGRWSFLGHSMLIL